LRASTNAAMAHADATAIVERMRPEVDQSAVDDVAGAAGPSRLVLPPLAGVSAGASRLRHGGFV
jgi:hypothetical protein